MKRIALYPGTFDPITNGHLDVLKRASKLFDEIIIAVAISEDKKPMFTLEQRTQMINLATASLNNVRVIGFNNLTVDLAAQNNADFLIRGLRTATDFEYELQLAYLNNSLNDSIESIYLMPKLEHSFISSSFVRSLLKLNAKTEHLLPSEVENYIRNVN